MNLWEREPDQLAEPSGCFDDTETAKTDINTGGMSTREEPLAVAAPKGASKPVVPPAPQPLARLLTNVSPSFSPEM